MTNLPKLDNINKNQTGKGESASMAKNPYTVLGVSESATDEEIRAAYRRLAKQYHPDLNPNDQYAAAKMNDVNVAYDQIKTAEKRAAYRDETRRQSYQQNPYGTDPWQTYYRTGQGYYGGSYTGGQGTGGNEPPFGWSSIFEESQRRRSPTYHFRIIRIIMLALAFLMMFMFGRCVLSSFVYACYYPIFGSSNTNGSIDNAKVSEIVMIGDQDELS